MRWRGNQGSCGWEEIYIQTLEVIEGKLSRRAQELVLDWAELHQKELLEDWELCRQHLEPRQIEPLH